uniref:Uncharacterized protein n=1 Tax=Rhizophora mucronata TaxID=61149 RepID=A0A2P2PCV8_RHIMU
MLCGLKLNSAIICIHLCGTFTFVRQLQL